jgi:Tfp pilus assembly protein PilZ
VSRYRPQPRRQRRFRRRLVRVLVDFYAEGAPRCEYATTLGAGGIFIETEQPLRPGALLRVRFRLPGGSLLHAIEGRVNWQHRLEDAHAGDLRPSGMGIAFTDAAAAARLAHELERLEDD